MRHVVQGDAAKAAGAGGFRATQSAMDLFWYLLPGVCVLCNERSDVAMDLCGYCKGALPWLTQACPRCALPLQQSSMPACDACAARPPPYARTVAAFRYAQPIAGMVQRVKFGGDRVAARVLGSLFAEQLQSAYCGMAKPDVIVPVPLGRLRLLRRGHNQAALLARWVGTAAGLPADYDLCERTRDTRAQTGLGRTTRLRNLTGAFAVRGTLAGRCIAVLDDVMTTGATATSLTRALIGAGAAAVHVWVIARTMEPQPQRQPAHSATLPVR